MHVRKHNASKLQNMGVHRETQYCPPAEDMDRSLSEVLYVS